MEKFEPYKNGFKKNDNNSSLREELYLKYSSNKKLMEYLSKVGYKDKESIIDNIIYIKSMVDDRTYCKSCPGFNKCNKEIPHYLINLKFDGDFTYTYLSSCELKKKDENLDNKYLFYEFNKEFREIDLSNLDINDSPRKDFMIQSFSLLNNNKIWLYIFGNHKTGKTYSSIALLNELIKKLNLKGAFINYPKLVSKLSSYSFNEKEELNKQINKIIDAPILVIDDFGSEYINDFIRDSITLPILQSRSRENKITIINSLYSLNQIKEIYSIKSTGKARANEIVNLIETFIDKTINYGSLALY